MENNKKRKSRTTISVEKIRILKNMLNENSGPDEIAKILDIAVSTVYKWKEKKARAEEEEKNLEDLRCKPGRKPSKELLHIENNVMEIIQSDNSLTQIGIKEKLLDLNLTRSCPTISRILKKANITRKRLKRKSNKVISNEIITQRKLYSRDMRQIRNNKLYFLDETGINLHSRPSYGYSPKNVDAVTMVPANKGRNISIIMLISYESIEKFLIIDGPCNGTIFLQFLNQCLQIFRDKDDPILVIDNVRFHHVRDVEVFGRTNNITIKYLPAYSPQLNPIEECFSAIKNRYYNIRPYATTREELKSRIGRVIEGTRNDTNFSLENFYENMRKYLDLAFTGSFV